MDIQRTLTQLHMSANERAEPFVDHGGVLRDAKTGRPIHGSPERENSMILDDDLLRKSRSILGLIPKLMSEHIYSWILLLR